MRKKLAVLLTLLLAVLLWVCAAGAEESPTVTWKLEELGVTVELPEDLIVIVRATAEDADYLAVGLDPAATRAAFDAGGVALWAIPADGAFTLTLTGEPFEDRDYSGLPNLQLHMLLNLWRQRLELSGGTAESTAIFEGADTRWLNMRYTMGSLHAMQYETVDHGWKLAFRLVSAKEQTEMDRIQMDAVVYHSRVKE